MDDADSPNTRKRPRLDSGERAHRSMSADPLRATPFNAGPAEATVTSPQGPPSSQAFETANGSPPLALTPSKVTINVREPAAQTSPSRQSAHPDGGLSIRGGGGGEEHSAIHHTPSTDAGSPSTKVLSIASSPPRSPEIEVAEIEDISDDPGETRWKSLGSGATTASAGEAKDVYTLLLEQFPHSSGQTGGGLKKTVMLIAAALQKSISPLLETKSSG